MSEVQRFNVIIFFFINMGAPPEEEWDGASGAVAFIRKKMDLPQDAARSVRGYMAKIWTMLTNSEDPMRMHGTKCWGRVDVGDDTELSIANLTKFSVLYCVNVTTKPKISGVPAQCSPLQPIRGILLLAMRVRDGHGNASHVANMRAVGHRELAWLWNNI